MDAATPTTSATPPKRSHDWRAHPNRPKYVLQRDARVQAFCNLSPHVFLNKAQEERHALLKDAAEVMLLQGMQDILYSETFLGKNATPPQNISFGTRWDKVFSKDNDHDTVTVQLPKQCLAALQIGLAVQVSAMPLKPQAVELKASKG